MHTNHRRKSAKHHKPGFAWTGAKEFRRAVEAQFRARVKVLMFKEEFDLLPDWHYRHHCWMSVKQYVAWW